MKTLTFETNINAARERVWAILWEDDTYRKWTSVFIEDSRAESDWKEGSKIIFGDGKGSGMYSVIEKSDSPNTMIFRHLGEICDGVEKPFDPSTGWAGSLEKYFLAEENGGTKLSVEIGLDEKYQDFFNGAFPKALAIVKELSEA